jgi:hypothetical protein
MTFRYEFAAALDRCVRAERDSQRKMLAAEKALAGERSAVAALDAQAAETRKRWSVRVPAPALELAEREHRLRSLDASRRARASFAARALRQVAEARAELARCVRRRSAFERHRARAYEKHLRLEELREAAELDELKTLRRQCDRLASCLASLTLPGRNRPKSRRTSGAMGDIGWQGAIQAIERDSEAVARRAATR